MSKVKFTSGRIERFECEQGKEQSFLWCVEVPGLGVRATATPKEKRYIFQAKVKGSSMRLTIGKVSVWSIPQVQLETRRLQIQIDMGYDPCQVKIDAETEKKEIDEALRLRKTRETVTVYQAWVKYVDERKPHWSSLHYRDHIASNAKWW